MCPLESVGLRVVGLTDGQVGRLVQGQPEMGPPLFTWLSYRLTHDEMGLGEAD